MLFTSLTQSLVDQIWKEVTQFQLKKNKNKKKSLQWSDRQNYLFFSAFIPQAAVSCQPAEFGDDLKGFVVQSVLAVIEIAGWLKEQHFDTT